MDNSADVVDRLILTNVLVQLFSGKTVCSVRHCKENLINHFHLGTHLTIYFSECRVS